MTPEEVNQLIKTAISGKHHTIDDITSYSEFLAAKLIMKATEKLISTFSKLEKNTFEQYVVGFDYTDSAQKLELLATTRNMKICKEFYSAEKKLLAQKIKAYRIYLDQPERFDYVNDKES